MSNYNRLLLYDKYNFCFKQLRVALRCEHWFNEDMSWYRTHRPQQVADLDLKSAREALQGMMERGSIPHALLFAGPRGMGKTSSARILAAMLNDPANEAVVKHHFFGEELPSDTDLQLHEPDPEELIVQRIQKGSSYAINELDAASNRGIDDIRQLKERINLPPQEGTIAVYILDEVHMLTSEAFNALLKVLEEPPQHAVFVLATTEPHRIPETIRSRCTVISFHLASDFEVRSSIQEVLETEDVTYQDEALDHIVSLAAGSFRDAIKLTEQIHQQAGDITVDAVQKHAPTGEQQVPHLIAAIIEKDERAVAQIFQTLRAEGVPADHFGTQLLRFLHRNLLVTLGIEDTANIDSEYETPVLTYLLKHLTSPASTHEATIPLLELEVACLNLVFRAQQKANKS